MSGDPLAKAIRDKYASPRIGSMLLELADTQQKWSEAQFGTRAERGPLGPIRHMAKEVRELEQEPGCLKERADILILLLDSCWRQGISVYSLLDAALSKMQENRLREWPKPTSPDQAVEHVR